MNRVPANSGTFLWSLAALLPVAIWFLLTARLAIFQGADLTASADIALRALITAQAFVIPLLAAGTAQQSPTGITVAVVFPVLAGLPFAAIFWLAGTLDASAVITAEIMLIGAAVLCTILRGLLEKWLPPRLSSALTPLAFGLAAVSVILFRSRWIGWIG
ncbi:MAG: hypothetical protein PVG76_10280 [Chromatiales bacterium]|jgi:hypothetical protein